VYPVTGACLGELVQIDGSHYAWFEERGPNCCLTVFIDDATGRVLGARFSPTETTAGYFEVLHRFIREHGIPLALYSDRHSILTKHDTEDPKPTQFERALLQLQIEPILARSPQAKGRVERLFQTLQDRLCKALNLGQLNGIEHANAWLGQYIGAHNRPFAVTPRQSEDAHRAKSGSSKALQRICAHHHQRQLGTSMSCQFEGQTLQVHPGQSLAPKGKAQIDIVQNGDGRLELLCRGNVRPESTTKIANGRKVSTCQRAPQALSPHRLVPENNATCPNSGDISTLLRRGHFHFGLTNTLHTAETQKRSEDLPDAGDALTSWGSIKSADGGFRVVLYGRSMSAS
jgi:hypothetical protein